MVKLSVMIGGAMDVICRVKKEGSRRIGVWSV